MLKVFGYKRICGIFWSGVDTYRIAIVQSHLNATSNWHLALLSQ
jgi:hypothetical protein